MCECVCVCVRVGVRVRVCVCVFCSRVCIVVLAREGTHGIEECSLRPVKFLAAPCKHHVMLTELNELHRKANAVCAG